MSEKRKQIKLFADSLYGFIESVIESLNAKKPSRKPSRKPNGKLKRKRKRSNVFTQEAVVKAVMASRSKGLTAFQLVKAVRGRFYSADKNRAATALWLNFHRGHLVRKNDTYYVRSAQLPPSVVRPSMKPPMQAVQSKALARVMARA
jgi:hypothetical protein